MSEQALRLEVSADAKNAMEALSLIASSLTKLKSAVSKGLNLGNAGQQIEQFGQSVRNGISEDTVARLERMADAVEKIGNQRGLNLGKILPQDSVTAAMGNMQKQAQQTSSALQPMVSGARQVQAETEEAATAAGNASKGFKGFAESLFGASKGAEKHGSMLGKLVSSIGRIAFYRAIRSAIKAVTQAFSEGYNNVLNYSRAIGGDFAKSIDSATASLGVMKNSLGAAIAPALQAVIPILNAITSAAIMAFNALNQFLSLLGGHGSWTRAKAGMDSYTKSAKGAGGATKDLLADWDELNIIQSQGGGGGGGSALDYEDMFEEVEEFDSRIKAIVGWLQEHMDLVNSMAWGLVAAFAAWKLTNGFKIDLIDVGKRIAKLILWWIAFAAIIHGVKKIWKGFADQLENGINWGNFKEMIFGSVLVVLGLAVAFKRLGAGFGLLGVGIALAINPIKELAETGQLSNEALTQLSVAIGAVAGGITLLAGGTILTAVKYVLGIGLAAYGAGNAFKSLKDQWENGINWENYKGTLKSTGLVVLGLTIAFGLLGGAIGLIASGLADLITPIKELVENGWDFGEMSTEAFAQLETSIAEIGVGIALITGNWWVLAIAGVLAVAVVIAKYWGDIAGWFEKNVTQPITELFDTLGKDLASFGDDPIGSIQAAWGHLATWFYNNVTVPVLNFFIDMMNGIYSGINTVITFLNNTLGTNYELNEMIPKLDRITEEAETLAQELQGGSEPKRSKNITGTASEDSMLGYADAVRETTNAVEEAAKTQDAAIIHLQERIESLDTSGFTELEESNGLLTEELAETDSAFGSVSENLSGAQTEAENFAQAMEAAVAQVTAWQQAERNAAKDDSFIKHMETYAKTLVTNLGYVEDYYLEHPGIDLDKYLERETKNHIGPYLKEYGLDLESDVAQKILGYFKNKWKESLTSEDWEGDLNGLVRMLNEAIENPDEIPELPEADDSALTSGLASTVSSVHGYVSQIRAAIASLSGLSFGFSGGLFGGRFNVTVPAMAAEGGMFGSGEMFIAREAGPELVGRIGNKTGVANNDQIVNGIAGGVAAGQAEQNALLRQQNNILTQLLRKKFTAEVQPSAGLGRVNEQSQRMYERIRG